MCTVPEDIGVVVIGCRSICSIRKEQVESKDRHIPYKNVSSLLDEVIPTFAYKRPENLNWVYTWDPISKG